MSEEPDWLNPTEQRAWRSLIRLLLVGLPDLERTFRRYGLVQVEYAILVALSEGPDEGIRLCDLATATNTSPSRLSHRMHKLCAEGWVEQKPCAEDGRVTYAVITDRGRELMAKVAPEHVEDVRRLVFDQITAKQTAALAEVLGTIAEPLSELEQSS